MWTSFAFAEPHVALQERGGGVIGLPVSRWAAEPSPAEAALLAGLEGPVLDVGCGPGRLAAALGARGVHALGIDVSSDAVARTRSRGAAAVRRSIFEPVPMPGAWRAALLLDGNVGIGGDPIALLRRLTTLLRPGGTILVEVEGPGSGSFRAVEVRLDAASGWSPWARVGLDALPSLALAAGCDVRDHGEAEGRWFATLRTPSAERCDAGAAGAR